MQCMGANFAKKNSFLVAKIVPYYTERLHLLTFHILRATSAQRYCTRSQSHDLTL